MSELLAFQDAFVAAVGGERAALSPWLAPGTGEAGLSVYRNTIAKGCVDALAAMPLSPALVPALAPGQDRMALFSTDGVALNAAARARLGLEAGDRLRVQVGLNWLDLPVHGSVTAPGAPLAVMDIAGAQGHFQWLGRLTRIDVKLAEAMDRLAQQ